MTLERIFGLEPAPIFGQFVRRVSPLGEWPSETALTEAQKEQRRQARLAQVGQAKAANRFQR